MNLFKPALLSSMLLCTLLTPVYGQQQADKVFDQTALAKFNAQHALDLLNQLPTFVLSEGNNERGLSGASSNVLIDGAVPLSKSDSIETLLRQLPMNQIAGLELYTGQHPFSQLSEYTQVVNIIKKDQGATIDWRATVQSQHSDHALSEAILSMQTRRALWHHTVSAKWVNNHAYSSGDLALFSALQQQQASEIQREHFAEREQGVQLALVSRAPLSNGSLQLSASAQQTDWLTRYRWTPAAPAPVNGTTDNEQVNEYELGFDWLRDMPEDWQWQLTGLARREQSDLSIQEWFNQQPAFTTFAQRERAREQVLRLAYSNPAHLLQPSLGIEGSYNSVTADTRDDGNTLSSKVTETRYEPFLAASWHITPQWQFSGKLALEQATLTSGNNGEPPLKHRLLKPQLKLGYDFSEASQLTFSAQHQAEQLDFALFQTSQSSGFERTQNGSEQLKPMQYTELMLTWQYARADLFEFTLSPLYQWQQEVHEYQVQSNGNGAITNAGRAHYFGLDSEWSINTEHLLSASRIELSYTWRDARYKDPLSGVRPITDLTPHEFIIGFRRDQATLSWGVEAFLPTRLREYYHDEVLTERSGAELSAFIQTQIGDGLSLRAEMNTLNKAQYRYTRVLYDPDRSHAPAHREVLEESIQPQLSLTLSGQL
ncbi:TonB-dependent receptor [Pseudoalteromonas sp. OOF1S-7]|uniref:TonB-dependent receptor n=1 Tax=Pseudoalteromonas sp. OOF1S-7 TaxID=2917757 RepID=UPI001EF62768|nr:TonB-dependent receptor [Pseudoalteromonas sp. OOF1S-7]MCG7536119.1 TonB-dependent receptor [Pseudoalteromonas sp. OOF1S-7]